MLFSELVRVSGRVAGTPGRLEKIEAIADFLRRSEAGEIETAVAFLSGRLRQGRIGIGGAALSATAPPPSPEPTLELTGVNEAFARIATARGAGSSESRKRWLGDLLSRATTEEQSFIVRLLFGELRQGAQEGIMMEAVARAAGLPLESIRRASMAEGDLGPVARAALTEGEAGLRRSSVRLFQPLRPMLAQPADDVASALEKVGGGVAALEFKLDGARVQIHKQDDEVRIFTRGLQDVTAAVPDVVETARAIRAGTIILDGEAIALRADGTPHPFQVSMRRFGRRLNVERLRESLPLSLFVFDVLYLDGRALVDEPHRARTELLEQILPSGLLVPRRMAHRAEEAEEFLARALAAGHEGIMVKNPCAPYEAGSRGSAWLKLKRVETLDLVVLAAEWGSGRRRGWLSNLHLGARDPATGGFVMLGKTFKGMTDDMLRRQTEALLAMETSHDEYTVYVRPELVVEIAFADVQTSPRYPGGFALRFARVKSYRTDKTPAEADTIDRIREIHRRGHPHDIDVNASP